MGSVLSVLFRMTSGKLKLHTLFANAESGMGPLVAAGALRPLLGRLSGIVAYVLLQAAIVPIDVPEGAAGTNKLLALAIVRTSASAGHAGCWPAPRAAPGQRRRRATSTPRAQRSEKPATIASAILKLVPRLPARRSGRSRPNSTYATIPDSPTATAAPPRH